MRKLYAITKKKKKRSLFESIKSPGQDVLVEIEPLGIMGVLFIKLISRRQKHGKYDSQPFSV